MHKESILKGSLEGKITGETQSWRPWQRTPDWMFRHDSGCTSWSLCLEPVQAENIKKKKLKRNCIAI